MRVWATAPLRSLLPACRRTYTSGGNTKAPPAGTPAKNSTEERQKPRAAPSPGSRLAELMSDPSLAKDIRAPRLPIVLCHGLYGFDVRGPFLGIEYHYWSATLDLLQKRIGAKVYVHGVPPTGSIKERAESLHRFLCNQGFEKGQKLNFVAHSMGGLDARHIITHIRPTEYTPASLTTLATPHRGSPFMDWCNTNIGVGKDLIDDMINEAQPSTPPPPIASNLPYSLKSPLLVRDKVDKNLEKKTDNNVFRQSLSSMGTTLSKYILSVFDQPAYAMLSTRYMTQLFNPTTPNVDGVKYFSVAARAHEMSVLHPLWLPKLMLDKAAESGTCGGEADGSSNARDSSDYGNDGLVSIRSAQWGEFLGIMENWDHWDIRGPGGTRRLRTTNKNGSQSLSNLWISHVSSWLPWWPRKQQATASQKVDDEWDWRAAALSEYGDKDKDKDKNKKNNKDKALERDQDVSRYSAAYAMSSVADKVVDPDEASRIAERLAQWISKHLPARRDNIDAAKDQDEEENDSRNLLAYLTLDRSKPLVDTDSLIDSLQNSSAAQALRERLPTPPISRSARLSTAFLELVPFFMHARNTKTPKRRDPFEDFWLAICRNLHDHGL